MAIQINLTLKQIYDVLCPECKKKVLDLASAEGAKEAVRGSLKKQLEAEGAKTRKERHED